MAKWSYYLNDDFFGDGSKPSEWATWPITISDLGQYPRTLIKRSRDEYKWVLLIPGHGPNYPVVTAKKSFSKHTPVFAVYGPSAEFGDGEGLLAVFASRDSANLFIKDERENLVESYGARQDEWPWPYNSVGYHIEEKTVEDFTDEDFESMSDFITYINDALAW